ncbi:hypothetical protein FJT64_022494 [Amphibalanus amphitrite]|uniref:Nucleoplasmin core domain-containing protein n=1 Tax=Amphibalanus amphitrite TaxID=1232801 RepID=A0A6A4WEY4_AMPAM|nr:nucleoplasmin-like protein ANO39 isoform X2 [Amphibalanus amphitrite]XP_043216611.1 nucleoplasmin-like protein ANO39 isoform X2 [Amphibalanus amphitrite]KAF0305946.1 hypothetical protein FJT64_022494 [Amphibalanus amphitrite]
MLQDWFFGTVLSKETSEYRWLPTFSEVDESCDSVDLKEDEDHHKTLELTMAVLSPDAKQGEVQEIEVSTKDSREADVAVTIAVLVGGSIYQSLLKVELPQVPATIRLKRGEGPVHLIGKEYVDRDIDPDEEAGEEEEGELDEAAEEELVVEPPVQKIDTKKRKKPETNGKAANSNKAKRSKNGTEDEDDEMDDEEDDMEDSDEDYEEEAPQARGKKAAKKGAATAADTAAAKKAAAAAKKAAGGSGKKAKKGAKAKA